MDTLASILCVKQVETATQLMMEPSSDRNTLLFFSFLLSCSRAASQILNLAARVQNKEELFSFLYFFFDLSRFTSTMFWARSLRTLLKCAPWRRRVGHGCKKGNGCGNTKGLFLMTEDGVNSPGSTLIIPISCAWGRGLAFIAYRFTLALALSLMITAGPWDILQH